MVRFKQRYLLCEIQYENELRNDQQELSAKQLKNTILESIHQNYGELGVVKAGNLQIKYWNTLTNIFLVRIARDYRDMLWTSLIFLNNFNGNPCKIKTLHCSATIKKCEIKAQRYLSMWIHGILKNEQILDDIKQILKSKYKIMQQELKKLDDIM
ncbi:hypothetical protein PPERSA_03496 [Pseudocohnilembus persalinus]|uniref:Ribonuclease P/MRP protein subunit POP5 n=1 Tax=Pseudocohnilembus persalinus TaxID=266149 RepID=A0A0V0QC43_PSEPJ|nr:hypothetical protein PPERSA_03496 [Pseudocohnilembus persalinus]|eukprot:KRW99695.1 hypothetical protein PPERSA_03496 [Pseudocohnilembus persalinus]